MGKLGREALSPKELASFQDSISSIAVSQKDAALNNDSLDADAVLQLLSQQVDESVTAAESSQGNYQDACDNQYIMYQYLASC